MNAAIENTMSQPLPTRVSLLHRENARDLLQTIWVVGDQAVVSLASFITTVIVGRFCGRAELGIFVLATTTFWLVTGIPNALTWTPYTSRAPRMPFGRRASYCGSVTIHTVLITAAIATLFGIAGLLPSSWFGQSDWFSAMCLALVPFTLLMTLREHVRRMCMSQVAANEMLSLDIPIAVAQLLFMLILARSGQLTANRALLAGAASCSIAALWFVRHRTELDFRPRRAKLHWSYNLQFGRWLLGVSLVWLVTDSMYRWIVGWQYGLDGLGRFASAQAVVLFINPLLLTASNFGRALSSNRYATGGMPELRRMTLQATLLLAAIAGVAFVALAAVGGPLVRLLFGEQYSGLGGVVATLCLGMLARIISVPIDASLSALRQGRAMFVAMIVQLVVVVVGIPLIGQLGLNGVGYTMAIACTLSAAVEWYWFLQCDRVVLPLPVPVALGEGRGEGALNSI
jgi:O-antigen/teichoic acid export membrane protein